MQRVEDILVPCLHKHLGTGNEFSMPRFVYAFAASIRVRAEAVAVLHSKRKHVRSYSLYSKHLIRTQFCTRTNITHLITPLSLLFFKRFSKVRIIYFCNQFDKNNRHTSHTASRSTITLQAEKAATQRLLKDEISKKLCQRDRGMSWFDSQSR